MSDTQPSEYAYEIDPKLEEILNFELPVHKVNPRCLKDREQLLLRDVLNEKEIVEHEKYVYKDKHTDKYMFSHAGILKLAEGIGAHWTEPRLDDRPNSNNEKGFYYTFLCHFADGTSFPSSGEANDKNTEKGKASQMYKQNQAFIRGMGKSLLRGIGLYELISYEGEADAFESSEVKALKSSHEKALEDMQRDHQKALQDLQQEHENALAQMKRAFDEKLLEKSQRNHSLTRCIEGMYEFIALPDSEDPTVPIHYLHTFMEAEDEASLLSITQHENKFLAFVANQYMKKVNAKKQARQQEEQQLNAQQEDESNDTSSDDGAIQEGIPAVQAAHMESDVSRKLDDLNKEVH